MEKEKELTLRLIGEMLEKGLGDADEYKKCFVKLTPVDSNLKVYHP